MSEEPLCSRLESTWRGWGAQAGRLRAGTCLVPDPGTERSHCSRWPPAPPACVLTAPWSLQVRRWKGQQLMMDDPTSDPFL